MFQILWVEKACTLGMLLFFAIGTGILLFLAARYRGLMKDAENMSITKRKELKAIKTKFFHSYGKKETEEDLGFYEQVNVTVFVDKAVEKLKFCGLKPRKWKFLSGQCILASIVFAGCGIFRSIVAGKTFREFSPFYLFAGVALYLYFSVQSICNLETMDKMLRLSIVEYIENHMVNRVQIARAFKAEEKVLKTLEEKQKEERSFSKEKEKELESLLQEFLV